MITVLDAGRPFSFEFDAMMAYHGPSAPGGVAHAVKLMELAFPILSPDAPPERREITVNTSFTGPGVRDTFELVTRAVTGERYDVKPEHGADFEYAGYRQRFVFHIGYRGKTVTLLLREGIVRDEFLELVGKGNERTKDDNMQLAWLKEEMTERVMKLHASAVYETVSS